MASSDGYNLNGNNFQDSGYDLTSPYASNDGFFDAYRKLVDQQHSLGSGDRPGLVNRLNTAGDQFKNLFTNYVGRAPTADELGKFFKENAGQTITSTNLGRSENDPTGVRNNIANYIGDTFQQTANTEATNKLTDLSSQAGGLADQYTTLASQSLSNLSDSLKQYQTSLFDKLRPQLNLAAQASGYQDSGGQTLQEQGALKDLGNQATAYLLPIQKQYQDTANSIRYGGASAPYSLASSMAVSQPNVFAGSGSNALNFNNNVAFGNYDYQHQLQLMNAQRLQNELLQENTRPSFGYSLSNSFANKFGSNLADIGKSGIQGGMESLSGGSPSGG